MVPTVVVNMAVLVVVVMVRVLMGDNGGHNNSGSITSGDDGGDGMMLVAMIIMMIIRMTEVIVVMYELNMDLWKLPSFLHHVTSDSSLAFPFLSGRAQTEGFQCCFSGLHTIVFYSSQCLTSAQGQKKLWVMENKAVLSSPSIPRGGPSHHPLT